nr:MAG TPA: hypothetical protein [Caudoviricetes sp.]
MEWDLKDRASAGRLVSFFMFKTGKRGNFI